MKIDTEVGGYFLSDQIIIYFHHPVFSPHIYRHLATSQGTAVVVVAAEVSEVAAAAAAANPGVPFMAAVMDTAGVVNPGSLTN